MATAHDIPPDLWQRLARLDGTCDCSMVRRTEYQEPGANGALVWNSIQPRNPNAPQRRAWFVRIAVRGGGVYEMVNVSEPALADALAGALLDAEARGWHRKKR